MFTVIVFLVIGILVVYWVERSLALALFTGILIGGIGAAWAALFTNIFPKEFIFEKEIQLVARQDKFGQDGIFFLGSGKIKQNFYYAFYQKNPDGSISLNLVPAEKAKIFEEDRKDGILEVYKAVIRSEKLRNWCFPPKERKYVFRIPKGSIKRDLLLDL